MRGRYRCPAYAGDARAGFVAGCGTRYAPGPDSAGDLPAVSPRAALARCGDSAVDGCAPAAACRGAGEGMERRHRGRVDDHRRQEPIAPKGLLMAFKQVSYETAKKAWDKVADGLWRRAQQLKLRVEKLEDYLRPIERTTLHHPGDALAHKKLEQQDPQLVKDHAQAVKAKAQEQTADQTERKAKALESIRKQRAKEKELGRDDRGRGR